MKKQLIMWSAIFCGVLSINLSLEANLASNGGFEDSGSWNIGGDLNRETWAAEWGSYGMAFYGWTVGNSGYFEQYVECDTNATYYFRIRGAREVNYTTGTIDQILRFFTSDTDWTLWGAYSNENVTVSSSEQWTSYTIEAPCPVEAGIVQMRCEFAGVNNTGSGNQVFKWDNVSLYNRRKTYGSNETVDEFSYDPDFDGLLEGKDRGNGFSSSWTTAWGDVTISDSSLPEVSGYPKPYGNKINVASTSGGAYREFSAMTTGSVYTASYFQYGNEALNNWGGLSLMSNGVERVFFGGNSANQAKMVLSIDSYGGSIVESDYTLNAGENYIIFGKYNFQKQIFYTKAYNATNDIPLLEPKDWDASVSIGSDRLGYVDGVRIAGGGDNPGEMYFDEVRVAYDWYSLLNNVKPPPTGTLVVIQ